MSQVDYTHVAFADESNWNQGQFRSISFVSATADNARIFHKELDALRHKYSKSEFKWSGRLSEHHGKALADFFFQRHDRMRVDVLVWDIEDSRHKNVPGRDDKANFARMYYHLLHNVLKSRWPDQAQWLICPDQQKDVDWFTLEQCLDWKSWVAEENLFTQAGAMPELREFYKIQEFRLVCSREYLLVQLADMFAGLAAYSFASFDKYRHWKNEQDAQYSLLDMCAYGEQRAKLSNSDKERLPVLHHVREQAGQKSLQVSLESSNGLSTKKPSNPLNFWLYTPQRTNDKAPVKENRY